MLCVLLTVPLLLVIMAETLSLGNIQGGARDSGCCMAGGLWGVRPRPGEE